MIGSIVRKEILENIVSLRFALSLILVIIVFALGGYVFVSKYKQQFQDYSKSTNRNLAELQDRAGQLHRLVLNQQEVYRKPKALALCSEGFEKSIPNYFKFNAFSKEYPKIKGRTNAFFFSFNDLDWVFIISLFLSFAALIFSYNSCCGEKESGTLRLILSSSLPRHIVLLGKYLALMFMVGMPLLLGILVNLIIVTLLSKDVNFGGREWAKIVGIIVLSFLYLSIFILLGILISSRTSRSVSSMVILLFLWVVLVILVPSSGRVVAKTLRKVPVQAEMNRKMSEMKEQWLRDLLKGKYGQNAGNAGRNIKDCNPSGRARAYTVLTDQSNKLIDEHVNQIVDQVAIGRRYTLISPTSIYKQACETIVGTGIRHFSELRRQISRYQAELRDYTRSRDAEDPNSLHLPYDEMYTAQMWRTISHRPVDFDTVPKFQERDIALGRSLKLAVWDIGLLALFNLVFFAASFVSFLRYDVR